MSGLKLFFESGEGDLAIKNGQLVVEEDINTLVLTSLFSDARAQPEDPIDELNPETNGYWAEPLMAIEGRHWGSKYWQYRRSILNTETVNGIHDAGIQSVQHLKDNGIVDTIDIITERQGANRVAQQITYKEPGKDQSTRITFRNLWDVIRNTISNN